MSSYRKSQAVSGTPAAEPFAADQQTSLVWDSISTYLAWREQAAEVRTAFERWTSGQVDSHAAFVVYRAELELEERTAQAYQESTKRFASAAGATRR